MNKFAFLVMLLPLTACATPGPLAQSAEANAGAEKVAAAESACSAQGISSHRLRYLLCVNRQIQKGEIQLVRAGNGAVLVENTQAGPSAIHPSAYLTPQPAPGSIR